MNGFLYDLFMSLLESRFLGNWRKKLLHKTKGKCLEIGFGTGVNFKYYPNEVEVFGIEPDASMFSRAILKNKRNFHLQNASAISIPFPNESFDSVVITLVLCSVPDVDKVIAEISRVLKSNGEVYLIEHVEMKNPFFKFLQNLLTPIWSQLAGGCHLNRNPHMYFHKHNLNILSQENHISGLFKIWNLKKY